MAQVHAFMAKKIVDDGRADANLQLYLRAAYKLAATHSDDPRTQIGALLVLNDHIIGAGVNQFPAMVNVTTERLAAPLKYSFMEHAERNAIFNARGIDTRGATMYCPFFACTDCARAIIQAKIWRVVGHKQCYDKYPTGSWPESIEVANTMLDEAGVKRDYFDGVIGGVEIQFNGETWEP
jgi:dCMP deaminase